MRCARPATTRPGSSAGGGRGSAGTPGPGAGGGGVVAQLDGNAGTGAGWLVVEGDESDRSVFALAPEIAVVTNIELDHHAFYASEAELRETFDAWLADVPSVVLS